MLNNALKPLPQTEEENTSNIPLPLLPISQTLDTLEKLPPQAYNLQHLPKIVPPVLTQAEQYQLDEYAEYMGRGGTIYVHVLSLDHSDSRYNANPFKTKDKEQVQQLTRKHFEDAAAISNERFKKLDINLKVVVVFDIGGDALSRQEFQERSADPKNRRKMPKGFEQEYNPMDSYVVVDRFSYQGVFGEGLAGLIGNLNQNLDSAGKGIDPNMWNFKDGKIIAGLSSGVDFFSMIRLDALPAYFQANFGKEFSQESDQINRAISEMIAYCIEHEDLHTKLARYSANSNAYKFTETINDSRTFFTLNPYFKDAHIAKIVYRENFTQEAHGHIENTVMKGQPDASLNKQKNNGYDAYMIEILQLLHGKNSEKFDKTLFITTLEQLRRERTDLLIILTMEGAKIDNFEELFVKFDEIERRIEAYRDVLKVLASREDFQQFLIAKQKQKISKSIDKTLKTSENSLINAVQKWANSYFPK